MSDRLRFLSFLVLFLFFTLSLQAQDLLTEIQEAHGGIINLDQRLEYEIRGTLQKGERTVPFVLKVSGEKSRLRFPGRVFIKHGFTGQWWAADGRISVPKRAWEGLRELYLLPFFPVRELAAHYRYLGDRNGRDTFVQRIERPTHIGFHLKTPVVRLSFHRQAHLLKNALFATLERNQSPVEITYSRYRLFEGIPIPTVVTRQLGDAPVWTCTIRTVDFDPEFSAGDFDFRSRGGAQ